MSAGDQSELFPRSLSPEAQLPSEHVLRVLPGEYLHTGGKDPEYLCNYCRKDISSTLRFKCAECENFDLCADCFCAGVELKPHKNTHAYRVADNLNFPVFDKEWTAKEELLLLDGVAKLGAGNWQNISKNYLPTKTRTQCEDHYWDLYMGRFGHCLPPTTILCPRDGPMQEVATESLLKDENADRDVIRVPGPPNAHQRGEVMARETREYKKERNKQDPADIIKQKPGHDLPGYMPLREDFDVEHENDAETYLADMEFLPDDHPGERELKLAVIKIYNAKLDEREKRKDFVQKRGLVDFKKQQAAERRRTKEERELTARLRVFARFHSPEEHEALVDGILKVRKLRKQIELYKHYRSMGCRTLQEVQQYEADRKRREQDMKTRKQRETTPYLFETGRTSTGRRLSKYQRRDGDPEDQNEEKSNGAQETTEDFRTMPGAELLCEEELNFIATHKIPPRRYAIFKDVILREALNKGIIQNGKVIRELQIDAATSDKVYDFFVKETGLFVGTAVASSNIPLVDSVGDDKTTINRSVSSSSSDSNGSTSGSTKRKADDEEGEDDDDEKEDGQDTAEHADKRSRQEDS